ncbi:MAG: GDP-L-fucose synthase [Phycisphaerales bacterium]|nr:GDP-L-fucose synthase [Phycisphaerales bacterium]
MTHERTFWQDKRVCVTGGAGFLGRALCRRLRSAGCTSITIPRRAEYDLTDSFAVRSLLEDCRPDIVLHLAAEVGGIGANRQNPGRFFYANMAMGLHLIEEARLFGVEKFVQVGTVCAYPKHCPVPFREETIWDGYPEETNAPYGIAKKALLVMVQAYRRQYGFNGLFVIPVNLYGPGDNCDPDSSHVIPALIRRLTEAKDSGARSVCCWGSGRPSREFLYVDDAADAIVRAARVVNDSEPINIGTGVDIRIAELAGLIAELVGYDGQIEWDTTQPDGQPQRRLDVSRALRTLGWRAETSLREGLRRTIDWWQEQRQPVDPLPSVSTLS